MKWALPALGLAVGVAIGVIAGRLSAPSGGGGEAQYESKWPEVVHPGSGEKVIGPCQVRRVYDGDEIYARCAERQDRVRLLRIDAPEEGNPGHEEARQALESLLQGQDIYLALETPGIPLRGYRGRILAYVLVGDQNANVEMVRLGWSKFWTLYGPGRFEASFRQAEDEASRADRGVWGMERELRRLQREARTAELPSGDDPSRPRDP